MTGVEWGAGASSFWLLQRLHRLISVEHNKSFFTSLHTHAHTTWPFDLFTKKWRFLHVPYEETIVTIGGDPSIISVLPRLLYTLRDPDAFAADKGEVGKCEVGKCELGERELGKGEVGKGKVGKQAAVFGFGIPYVDAPWKEITSLSSSPFSSASSSSSSSSSSPSSSSSSSSSSSFSNSHNHHNHQVPLLNPHELVDFIFIDGKARGACLARAVTSIQPHGGILVLDNSNRLEYRRVIKKYIPCHWIKYSENNVANPETETTIWITVKMDH